MAAAEQQVAERRFSPKEVADMFKISTESLRNWERLGKIPPSIRTMGGHRRYTIEHIRKIAEAMGEPVPAAATT